MKFWTVDTFTTERFKGNPAAVVIVKDFPSNQMCLDIAAEFNLSETAFVKDTGEGAYHIRWFTPTVEVDLCGHATLASAHVLFKELKINADEIKFQSLSGILKVKYNNGKIELTFPVLKTQPYLGPDVHDPLFINAKSFAAAEGRLIVEFSSINDVLGFNPGEEQLRALESECVVITTRGAPPYDFVSRCFSPKLGIFEDPVTGSDHCALADYWKHKLGKDRFTAFQASKRTGTLFLHHKGEYINISGDAVTFARGSFEP